MRERPDTRRLVRFALAAGVAVLAISGAAHVLLGAAGEAEVARGRASGTAGSLAAGVSVAPGRAPGAPALARGLDPASSPLALRPDEAGHQIPSNRAPDAGGMPHAREHAHASEGPVAPPATRAHAADPRGASTADLAAIRAGLGSQDARTRAEALRAARDLRSPELVPDVVLLLQREGEVPVRRLATQVLAQADTVPLGDLLRSLKKDKDPIVQANAAYGLARGGDEREQAWLLCLCDAARRDAPALLPVVATALEDPSIRAPAVIARFQQLADDPAASPAARERARAVLRAKQGT